MQETFTIAEIRNYIMSQDSLGDVAYNLSAENIIKANQIEEDDDEDFGENDDLDDLDWPE